MTVTLPTLTPSMLLKMATELKDDLNKSKSERNAINKELNILSKKVDDLSQKIDPLRNPAPPSLTVQNITSNQPN